MTDLGTDFADALACYRPGEAPVQERCARRGRETVHVRDHCPQAMS